MSTSLGMSVFAYPTAPHVRRHGPRGYRRYQTYKQWLRDEFYFRCVYCLYRERWCPFGADSFGVDHFLPQSTHPLLVCEYDNLLYVCNRCNSAKKVAKVLDPCSVGLAAHIEIQLDGTLVAKTKEGWHVIRSFNLNFSSVRDFRKRKIESLDRWQSSGDSASIDDQLRFPTELPDLEDTTCENSRPEGGLLPKICSRW